VGVSIHGGTPIAGWFIGENPNLKWMITRGTPFQDISGTPILSPKMPENGSDDTFFPGTSFLKCFVLLQDGALRSHFGSSAFAPHPFVRAIHSSHVSVLHAMLLSSLIVEDEPYVDTAVTVCLRRYSLKPWCAWMVHVGVYHTSLMLYTKTACCEVSLSRAGLELLEGDEPDTAYGPMYDELMLGHTTLALAESAVRQTPTQYHFVVYNCQSYVGALCRRMPGVPPPVVNRLRTTLVAALLLLLVAALVAGLALHLCHGAAVPARPVVFLEVREEAIEDLTTAVTLRRDLARAAPLFRESLRLVVPDKETIGSLPASRWEFLHKGGEVPGYILKCPQLAGACRIVSTI